MRGWNYIYIYIYKRIIYNPIYKCERYTEYQSHIDINEYNISYGARGEIIKLSGKSKIWTTCVLFILFLRGRLYYLLHVLT